MGSNIKYFITIFVLVILGVFAVTVIAQNVDTPDGAPVLPAVYYGSVKLGNKDVNDGLKVEAFVDGNSCGQDSKTKDGKFILIVRGKDSLTPDCASEGDEISIMVDGNEVGVVDWSSGKIVKSDLKITGKQTKEDAGDFVGGKGKNQR